MYKKYPANISVLILTNLHLAEDIFDPTIVITEKKTDLILSQTFSFVDFIGGKAAITSESKNQAILTI